jgi:hypothetical protein
MKAIPADYRPRSKLLKLRPALSQMPIVALWRKNAETEALRAFIAAPLAKPTKKKLPACIETSRAQRSKEVRSNR